MTKTAPNPYARLMRWHQPVGIWLVFWPCAWTLTLFGEVGSIPLFLLGAIVTRSAGCVINDMADREFDRQVARTKSRPLASGELSLTQAAWLLAGLAMISMGVLALMIILHPTITLPVMAGLAVLASALIAAYPFMKRITWWPQAFLGLTFNAGVWFAALAADELHNPTTWLLYAGCFFWTLGYDTIYGHQDMNDDEKAGIKSTSRRFGAYSRRWIGTFYAMTVGLLAAACVFAQPDWILYYVPALIFMTGHFIWQLNRTHLTNPHSCLKSFKSNVWLGAVFWLALLAPTLFS